MDFSTPNFWIIITLVLLAIAIVWASVRKQPVRSSREIAYENGLTYALLEMHRSHDKEETADRLFEEAQEGKLHDPSPFDDAILAVLDEYVSERDARERVLTEVCERLRAMERLGEASSSETGVALALLETMLCTDAAPEPVLQEAMA